MSDYSTSGGSTGGGNALYGSALGPPHRLTAKPHAFAGAVLSPKHARELTPNLCMNISSALSDHHQQQQQTTTTAAPSAAGKRLSSSSVSMGAAAAAASSQLSVPYTVWITEAWRVLGWAEPSAALFWEMATMYHTLVQTGRIWAEHMSMVGRIPPILSCGSTSSMGSGNTHSLNNNSTAAENALHKAKKLSSVASAKELPVWLIGTFLLLHCEEFAYNRNLAGQDERRFYGSDLSSSSSSQHAHAAAAAAAAAGGGGGGGKMDFNSLFQQRQPSALSPRTRLHAGWNTDNSHCTAYVLRHLRKILLLSAISSDPDATHACMHLSALHPSPPTSATSEAQQLLVATVGGSGGAPSTSAAGSGDNSTNAASASAATRLRIHSNSKQYDANELRRQHDDEHGNVGLSVRLKMEDLDRLDFILQPPSGGGIDDPPLNMGEFLWNCLYHDPPPPTASIPLAEVEREIRQHLELDLAMTDEEDEDVSDGEGSATNALARLSLDGGTEVEEGREQTSEQQKHDQQQPDNLFYKELTYKRLRGTTILLKPNPPEQTASADASTGSGDMVASPPRFNGSSSGRLHDLNISDCSDAHIYLLQPFEHATVAACTNCVIVVGAVAGLLHIVDCERTFFTCASRRILVSNSCDVQLNIFTPSPPLFVGDNRTCQFAPYNTYYDGLREDLLAAGLAAVVASDREAPFGPPLTKNDSTEGGAVAWPPLQCASNKWKQPIEVSKLEVPQVPGSPVGSPGGQNAPQSPGADDRATTGNDATLQAPVLLPANDFSILFVPLESEATRQRRLESRDNGGGESGAGSDEENTAVPMESNYCRMLAEVLQLSPFRLPVEYERRVLSRAERMKTIQQAVKQHLSPEQQRQFEEELNRGFRDWLVTSGNLRQVLDLVHLEVKGGA